MISRKRALDAARHAVESGSAADLDALAQQAELPPEARQPYQKMLAVFNDYYMDLLQAQGKNFKALVRSTFKSKTDYLIQLNRFNQTEKELNAALRPHMAETTEGFNEIVAKIEQSSAELRRDDADKLFASDPRNPCPSH